VVADKDIGWRLVDASGSVIEVEALPDVPIDIIPGETILINEGAAGWNWYMVLDKNRSWDGARWKGGGTLSRFDPGSMSEAEFYEYRRRFLKKHGWIEK